VLARQSVRIVQLHRFLPAGGTTNLSYNPEIHQRRSIRLRGYDYSQPGAYFVTLCTSGRECLFGDVADGEVALNYVGRVVHEGWSYTEFIRPEVEVDEFVVMPNHLHGIITIRQPEGSVGAHGRAPLPSGNAIFQRPPRSLGSLIAGFKSAATKRINELRHTPGQPVWQRNYYEHIIRGETDLNRIRQYIRDNPARWTEDIYNPARISRGEP
jgi:REP element-mobilizing transposase RayT